MFVLFIFWGFLILFLVLIEYGPNPILIVKALIYSSGHNQESKVP